MANNVTKGISEAHKKEALITPIVVRVHKGARASWCIGNLGHWEGEHALSYSIVLETFI